MYFAGIDWADDHHDVVVLAASGERVHQFRIPHSGPGLTQLSQVLCSLGPASEMACILETRHGLLVHHLLESGFAVYPVNPKTVDRRRSPARAKTDAIDAALLARYGLQEHDRLRRLETDHPLVQELKLLTRDQAGLVQQQTRLLNQLTACLKDYYPLALQVFSKLNQPVTLAFLQAYPTLEHLEAAHPDELAAFFKHHRHPRPRETMQKVLTLRQDSPLRAQPIVSRARARLMLALVGQLAPLIDAIRDYDREIQRLFTTHSDSQLFQSLPGAGMRLAPRLLAEWGDDRGRYSSHESVAALAGTSPVPFQSGRYARVRKRMACVKPFRDALYQFAWLSVQSEPWARDYYRKKRAKGKSHSVAVRALSNNWVRIIYAMWQSQTPYCRQTFLKAQVKHGQAA